MRSLGTVTVRGNSFNVARLGVDRGGLYESIPQFGGAPSLYQAFRIVNGQVQFPPEAPIPPEVIEEIREMIT